MGLVVRGDRSGEKKCENAEAAVEYIYKRPHENFVIFNATDAVINEIKKKVKNVIEKGK